MSSSAKMEHTPTPWIAADGDGQYFVIAQEETGELIAVLVEPTSKGGHDILLPRDENYVKAALGEGQYELVYAREAEHKANAAFIVAAVNSHADLREAMKGATIAANIAGSLLKEKDARIADLVKALEEIRDGLADTGSTPGQRMTFISKADAHRIASAALSYPVGREELKVGL